MSKDRMIIKKLSNGIRVVLVPMTGVKSAAVGVYVATGSRYETLNRSGLSHFIEHMVFKGTENFPTTKDTSYLEGLGAIQNAWTSHTATAFWCKVSEQKWREGLGLMADLALKPLFPEKDLEIERGVILEEINRSKDHPEEMVSELSYAQMFAGNPLERPILGNPEVIRSLGRDELVAYHRKQYAAENIVVLVCGSIDIDIVYKEIESKFAGLDKQKGEPFIEYSEEGRDKLRWLSMPGVSQVHFELSVPGLKVADKRRFASTIMTSYLGQGLSSRLFEELREKRGLCYAVHAGEDRFVDAGIWSIYVGTSPELAMSALEGVASELGRLMEKGLSADDLARTKEKVKGPLAFSMENPVNQMNFYANQVIDRPDEVLSYDQVFDKFEAVTREEITDLASEILDKAQWHLAVVGPENEKLKQKLENYLSLS